jgi:tetratricopeptide (TPR) repeat protein
VESDTAANQFLTDIAPAFENGDLSGLLAMLHEQWPPDRLTALLASPSPKVLDGAARCLGLTASMPHCPQLAHLLGHADEVVSKSAEDALWSIWMQAGPPATRDQLAQAIQHIHKGVFKAALSVLDELLAADSDFAEAHHQRAIALHLLEQPEAAAKAYQRVLALNPYHFAAAAGLGHTYVERGDIRRALELYRLALQIHPGLAEIREAVKQIEKALRKRDVA